MSHSEIADQQVGNQIEAIAAPLALLPRPEQRLDDRPRITSVEEAELAFREIAWVNAMTAAAKAAAESTIVAINEAVVAALTIDVSDEPVPLSDRRTALETELLRWGDKNRASLCPGKKKSCDFRNGRLRWRDCKDSVERNPESSAKNAKAKIAELLVSVAALTIEDTAEQLPLAACLQRAVDATGYHGAISVTVDVNKTAAVTARKLLQITDEQLAAIEHQFKPGAEYVSAEPVEFVRDGVR